MLKLALVLLTFWLGVAGAQVQNYSQWQIPESAQPNQDTLKFYAARYARTDQYQKYSSPAAATPREIPRRPRTEPSVSQALERTALLSYMLYENGHLVVDQTNARFADQITDQTPLWSMSMGKSMASYVLGHAICQGMISSLDQRIDDWPLVSNTLYARARLGDLVNMRAGDQSVVGQRGFVQTGRNPNNYTLETLAKAELQGTTASSEYFNYNALAPNIVLNYVIYRSNGQFDQLMKQIFQEKVGTQGPVFFLKHREGQGGARTTFFAQRHDYLRIAIAMLNDWQTDTCEGKYLKEIFQKRKPKQGEQMRNSTPSGSFWAYRGYGGFFHTDYYGTDSGRHIMAMDGYGGQMIVIDFDQGRIVTTHAVHNDFDWKRLVAEVINSGKFKKYFWE